MFLGFTGLLFSMIFKHCVAFYFRIEELSKLNYSMDVELQKEREIRELMQTKLRLYGTPRRTSSVQDRSDSPGPVQHI